MINDYILELEKMNIGKIFKDESLSKYTTYKAGGIAKVIIFPNNREKLLQLLKYIKDNNIKYFILGNGSNVLFSSKYFYGIIIKLNNLNNVEINKDEVYVEAGYPIIKLCNLCADNNLGNLEFASGIPATIGGAIYSNAGAYNMEMSDIVKTVEIIDNDLNIRLLDNKDLNFKYRYSMLKDNKDYIVISAVLKLINKDKNEIIELMNKRRMKRMETQPLEYPSAGSVFRNPSLAPSGKLIEDLGLKGYSVGGAKVSEKHANFIINYDNAISEDIKSVIEYVQKKVRNEYDIELKPEQEFINWE